MTEPEFHVFIRAGRGIRGSRSEFVTTDGTDCHG
jgi:hypothetical protein